MNLDNSFNFKRKRNSFLMNTLIDKTLADKYMQCEHTEITRPELLNNLSSISALYLYTGVPPLAYGAPAPKIAETVNRTRTFNHSSPKLILETPIGPTELQQWDGDFLDFPANEIHSNFAVPAMFQMCMDFLRKYQPSIDRIAESTMDYYLSKNADLLTKGRQTCCPLTNKSIPAASAFRNAYDFLESNTDEQLFSGVEWIKATLSLFEKPTIQGFKAVTKEREISRYCKETKQRRKTTTQITRQEPHTYSTPEEIHEYLIDTMTSFEGYLKSMERAHKDRRAIASPNMFLRMFLNIIEDFHLELGKVIDGSTISIGGERKKMKIAATLNGVSITSTPNPKILQGTEDATKWNECLNPSTFGLMHQSFFDDSTRDRLGLPRTSGNVKLFQRICIAGNYLLQWKRIKLGPGPIAYSPLSYNRLEWKEECIPRMNQETQDWFNKIKGSLSSTNKVVSPGGMLMGMHNAASTTIGLIATGFRMDGRTKKVVSLRSSDDSMSVYVGQSWIDVGEALSMHKANLALVGINLSEKKTLFFPHGYGEYTSWYQDGDFVSQYGVETSAIRPQGNNPPDDFSSVAKGVMVSLQTFTINPLGATIRLRLGVDGVRRIWRVKYNPEKRITENIGRNVLLLADGGVRPWNFANCHLEETSIRELFTQTEEERDYLLRVRNPENPFNPDAEAEVVFSVEHGQLMLEQIDTPRTAFHFCKRSNRTINTETSKKQIEMEESHTEALKTIRMALPHTYLKTPASSTKISDSIVAALTMMSREVDMDLGEAAEYEQALQILQHGQLEEDGEDMDVEGSDIFD